MLDDSDFRNSEDRENYRTGEKYHKMVKSEGWKDLRKDIDVSIKNKIAEFETCKVDDILYTRGVIAGFREILNKVDNWVSTAIEIEQDIKGINKEDDDG